MFPAERRRKIAQFVNEQGGMSIPALSEVFKVSEMTIHRDLSVLEEMGLLRKTWGGALKSEHHLLPVDYQARLLSYQEEKDAIGREAAKSVKDGETIFLDAGTTSLSVAKHLQGFNHLIVYTNGPLVVLELAKIPDVDIFCTGGMLSKQTMAYVGPQAENALSQLRPDKCFIGAGGFTIRDGVMDPLPLEASIKRKIVEVSQEVYLVVAPDKFGRVSQHVSAPLEAIDVVIMHKDTPEQYCSELTARNIRCIIA